MKNLFVDMDGVLVDFDKKLLEIFGEYPQQFKKEEWKRIANYPNFYGSLDWMPNGKKLWSNILQLKRERGFRLYILTGLPMGDWAEPQKREWCKQNLKGYDLVITCFSRNKHYYANKDSVLIDDREKNVLDWKNSNGFAIQHKDEEVDNTINELIFIK